MNGPNLNERAMLASLSIRLWSARKTDVKISREVALQHNAKEDVGRYNKALVAKAALERVSKAANAARGFHAENTLPWLDDGVRILPAANFTAYKAEVTKLQDDFDAAVRAFCSDYGAIVDQARIDLNGLFNQADYPVDIRGRFGFGVRFMPLPASDDFRANIADEEAARIRDQIAGEMQEVARAAMADLWGRVHDVVSHMADKLKGYRVDLTTGKAEGVFRDSLVGNVRDLAALLPRLNVTGDSALSAIHDRIVGELVSYDAGELRENQIAREAVAGRADAILRDMAEFMV